MMKKRIRRKIIGRLYKEHLQLVRQYGSVECWKWEDIVNLGKKGYQYLAASVHAWNRLSYDLEWGIRLTPTWWIKYRLAIAENRRSRGTRRSVEFERRISATELMDAFGEWTSNDKS